MQNIKIHPPWSEVFLAHVKGGWDKATETPLHWSWLKEEEYMGSAILSLSQPYIPVSKEWGTVYILVHVRHPYSVTVVLISKLVNSMFIIAQNDAHHCSVLATYKFYALHRLPYK